MHRLFLTTENVLTFNYTKGTYSELSDAKVNLEWNHYQTDIYRTGRVDPQIIILY